MVETPAAVPTVSAYFNPVLSALRALGGSASNAEIDAQVGSELALTPDQLALPHKADVPDRSEHDYRCAWARTYLKKTGYLTNPRRAFWSLTPQGAAAGAVDAQAIASRVRAELAAEAAEAEADLDASASAEPASPGVRFDSRLVADLRRLHAQLLAQNKLVREEVITDAYARFATRFGPSMLRSLDGERLLTTMHGRGRKDSLVYWLEFKDDDELPACFGSIAGGSALKFGLYQSKDDGRWWTGAAAQQVPLTTEDAVGVVRKQRDQLIAAAGVLTELAGHVEAVDYDALQQRIEEVAPDVGETAWGHKYLALLYPSLLDDYHASEYQKFHLIKLLQRPGLGRYANARAFVALARELGIPASHLGTTLNYRDGNPHAYWRVGTTASGESEWKRMRDGQFIAVGWSEVGDLSSLTPDKASRERLRELMKPRYPDKQGVLSRKTQELFALVTRASERDLVLAMDGNTVVGIGRIAGDYFFQQGDGPFAHRRPVQWLNTDEWKLPQTEAIQTTFTRLGKYPENLIEVEARLLSGSAPQGTQPTPLPAPAKPAPLTGVPARVEAILERKGQVILYGPPGTGKTYWARTAIDELVARRWFGVAAKQIDDARRRTLASAGAVATCTFHPAYGYEDFIEGYRPAAGAGGGVQFALKPGIFHALCSRASADADGRPYFLLIDEINRGDVPRIFGELLTLLEVDKRGTEALLPVSGERFSVPKNVYVVATMNTADRSIALLDAALRRRFGFVELMPDTAPLLQASINGLPLGAWLDELNRLIVQHLGRNARNLQIGHAYFLDRGQPITSLPRFAQVLREDIIPLLEEHCYEDFGTLESILGTRLVLKGQQRVDETLFQAERHSELIDALLKAFPSITASPAAVEAAERASTLEADEAEGDEDAEAPS
jgi:5-methylcytosine-specific restriction protein B